MREYFEWSELYGGYQISPNWDFLLTEVSDPHNFQFSGSFRVFPARVLGISYGDYLRWCESYGATLVGKATEYIGARFDKPNEEVIDILNKRATEIFRQVHIGELKY